MSTEEHFEYASVALRGDLVAAAGSRASGSKSSESRLLSGSRFNPCHYLPQHVVAYTGDLFFSMDGFEINVVASS